MLLRVSLSPCVCVCGCLACGEMHAYVCACARARSSLRANARMRICAPPSYCSVQRFSMMLDFYGMELEDRDTGHSPLHSTLLSLPLTLTFTSLSPGSTTHLTHLIHSLLQRENWQKIQRMEGRQITLHISNTHTFTHTMINRDDLTLTHSICFFYLSLSLAPVSLKNIRLVIATWRADPIISSVSHAYLSFWESW